MQSRGARADSPWMNFGTGLSSYCLCCASSEAVPPQSRPSTRRSLFQVSVSGFRKPSNATPQNGGVIRVRSFPFPYYPSSLLTHREPVRLGFRSLARKGSIERALRSASVPSDASDSHVSDASSPLACPNSASTSAHFRLSRKSCDPAHMWLLNISSWYRRRRAVVMRKRISDGLNSLG